ncbi:MAG: efflux RND transporter permease subunit [Spirochaetaceae bacterium]
MSATERIIRRPVTIFVLFAAIAALGAFAYGRMPVAFFPEVDPPVMMLNTSYDAGPRQVEENVTRPLEGALAGISGVESMRSSSSEGRSRIVLEFDWDTDLTEATNDVRDILDRTKAALPDEAGDPRIFKFDPNSRSIMTLALTGGTGTKQLSSLAEDELESQLLRVAGVADVEIEGDREEIVAVEVDSTVLEAYGLTVRSVANALAAANREDSGGDITVDGRSLLIRTTGEFDSLEAIRDATVGYTGGRATEEEPRAVQLREVGTASFALEEAGSRVSLNGTPAVSLGIYPESGANTVDVTRGVRATLDTLRSSLPDGIELSVTRDDSRITRESLDQVTTSLLIGAALAMAVLLFFLHNLRAAIIIGLSIPVSLLATLLAMDFAGVTLNILSMSGLILGIGMIVDSSIVVLENIDRHRREGYGIFEAAHLGTSEMITAITASALTTMSVFIPVLIFEDQLGMMGILLSDISFVIIVAILSSLAVAALLVPVLASTYLPLHGYGAEHRNVLGRLGDVIAAGLDRLDEWYTAALARALRYRGLVLSAAAALLIVALSAAPQLGFIFTGSSPEDSVRVTMELREGTDVAETEKTALEMGEWVTEKVPTAETVVVESRGNRATVEVGFPSIRGEEYDTTAVRNLIREEIASRPDVDIDFAGNRARRLSGGDPVDIAVRGDDLEAATATAVELRRLLESRFPQVTEPSLDIGAASPELVVDVNHARAAAFDVSVSDITAEVRAAVDGTTATRYTQAGEEWDMTVRLPESQRRDIADIESLVVSGSDGTLVPLSSVAAVRVDQAPTEILREEEIRTIHLTADLMPGVVISDVQPRIEAAVAEEMTVPEGVSVEFAGEFSEIAETGGQLGIVLAVAILLVFAIMAGQFESFRMPFIVFFTIPLMFIGAVGINFAAGQAISMFALLGLVVLAGIVVNNGIVLVDYTNRVRARGLSLHETVLAAARTRFKPIIMTTLTTIFGMAPLAFFPGEGGQLTQPVGLTVIGGLTTSALFTLFVVPVLYTIIARKEAAQRERFDPHSGG